MSIKVLDCTLRDGAHINKGFFGNNIISSIVEGLVESNIDLIELGFLEDGDFTKDQTFFNKIESVENIVSSIDKKSSQFGLMLRTDRCDISKIRKSKSIDFIRIAFYKEHIEDVKVYAKLLKEFEYKVYLNPIAITNYSKKNILYMLKELNSINPDGVSVVDTFGAFDMSSFKKITKLFDEKLSNHIELGIHLHENLSSSLLLSTFACEEIKNRSLIVDTSVQGMGRVPGNLPSELFCNYLNVHSNADYNVQILVNLGQKYICQFKSQNEWGYNPIYMYSATLNIDRTYPEYYNDNKFTFDENISLQNMTKAFGYGNKFNQKYADEIIEKFKS